jgi:hypothetical protein
MELSVGELAQLLGQSQPRVSRHVRILADAGIVDRRKEGSWVFLAIADPGDRPLFELIDAGPRAERAVFDEDSARLDAVRPTAPRPPRYFAAHAATWDSIRSLHVAESRGRAGDRSRALGRRGFGKLVDIGTGTGRMIELFGPRARARSASTARRRCSGWPG